MEGRDIGMGTISIQRTGYSLPIMMIRPNSNERLCGLVR